MFFSLHCLKVWSVFVIYTTGNGLYAHEFRILTSIPWEDFESVARTYLQMWLSDCGLGYRVRRNGCLGELRALKHSEDWRRAMLRVCQVAEDGLGGELVIFNVSLSICGSNIKAKLYASSTLSQGCRMTHLTLTHIHFSIQVLMSSFSSLILLKQPQGISRSSTKRNAKACVLQA